MKKQDALKVIKTVKDDLNGWIKDQEIYINDQITDLYKKDYVDHEQKYSHKMGKLHMLLELKRYVNYDIENFVINYLEYKKRIQ